MDLGSLLSLSKTLPPILGSQIMAPCCLHRWEALGSLHSFEGSLVAYDSAKFNH